MYKEKRFWTFLRLDVYVAFGIFVLYVLFLIFVIPEFFEALKVSTSVYKSIIKIESIMFLSFLYCFFMLVVNKKKYKYASLFNVLFSSSFLMFISEFILSCDQGACFAIIQFPILTYYVYQYNKIYKFNFLLLVVLLTMISILNIVYGLIAICEIVLALFCHILSIYLIIYYYFSFLKKETTFKQTKIVFVLTLCIFFTALFNNSLHRMVSYRNTILIMRSYLNEKIITKELKKNDKFYIISLINYWQLGLEYKDYATTYKVHSSSFIEGDNNNVYIFDAMKYPIIKQKPKYIFIKNGSVFDNNNHYKITDKDAMYIDSDYKLVDRINLYDYRNKGVLLGAIHVYKRLDEK